MSRIRAVGVPARLDPEAARQIMVAAGVEPLEPYQSNRKPWRSRCLTCGEVVTPRLENIKGGHSGCKWCVKQAVRPDDAVSVMRKAGLEPLLPYPGSLKPWLCRCLKCGADTRPQYGNIRSGQRGCRECVNVSEAQAVEKMRAAGFEPLVPFPGINKPWSCRCTVCGELPAPRLGSVLYNQGGCRFCAGKVVDPAAAAEVMRQAGFVPLTAYPGSGAHWLCRCAHCDREVSPQYGMVRLRQYGCRWCAVEKQTEARRLDEAVAAKVMLEAGLHPLEPYPGTDFPWLCRCLTCGNDVRPMRSNVHSGGGGCRFCARRGFDATKPAVVYLVIHEVFGAIKVGIGSADRNRIGQHARYGWKTVAVVQTPGAAAPGIERAVLRWWRKDLGLPSYLSSDDMPQDGWTETAELDEVDIPETIRRIEHLARQANSCAVEAPTAA